MPNLDIKTHVFDGEDDWQPGDVPVFVGTLRDWFDAHPHGVRFGTACEVAERLGCHMIVCFGGDEGVPVVKFISHGTLQLMAMPAKLELLSARVA